MSVRDAILEFSRKQPEWLQDALRRIATHEELSGADKAEILAMLKTEHGLQVEGDTPSPDPLSEAHFQSEASATANVKLLELSHLKRVNRLASGQGLRFAPDPPRVRR